MWMFRTVVAFTQVFLTPVFDTKVFLAMSSSPCLVNKYTTFDLYRGEKHPKLFGKVSKAMLSSESHKLRIQIHDEEESSEFWNQTASQPNTQQCAGFEGS